MSRNGKEIYRMKRGNLMKYKIGMVLSGTITGLQPYGAFVSLDEETQGLIHVSKYKLALPKISMDS